jgi:lysophospholipase L1-like esterase
MNINTEAKTILCYGDSNTWGQKPDKNSRFPVNVRWTGLLQEALGDDYYVIEEGLGSRTTDLDYGRKRGRNGKTYLEPCLDSQSPLDYVILMLGTNDLKIDFNRSAADIANALKGLVEVINQKTNAKIILVSPILVDDKAPHFYEYYTGYYDHEAVTKSEQLAAEIQKVAETTGCTFVNAAEIAGSGDDGLHFSQEAHSGLAKQLIAIFKG